MLNLIIQVSAQILSPLQGGVYLLMASFHCLYAISCHPNSFPCNAINCISLNLLIYLLIQLMCSSLEYQLREDRGPAFFFLSFLDSFIHMCIHCLGHFSPLHPTPPSPLNLPLASRQNLFCPFLQFC
jgi:hypothetical protein